VNHCTVMLCNIVFSCPNALWISSRCCIKDQRLRHLYAGLDWMVIMADGWDTSHSWNHRMLEKTIRNHLAQTPFSEQGYLQLDQVAQSPVQPGLECFQGWGIHHLSGQPVPVFHHPYCKIFLPISSLNLPSLGLKQLLLVFLQHALLKIFFPSFL